MLKYVFIFALAITPAVAADLAPKKPAAQEKSMGKDKTTTEEKTTIEKKSKTDSNDKSLQDNGKFKEDCDPTKEVCPDKK